MSQTLNQRQRTGPVLRPLDVQLIHAHRRIQLLQETLQAVRDDLIKRAIAGRFDFNHSVQLDGDVWDKLREATK